jgi:hypothetical protein
LQHFLGTKQGLSLNWLAVTTVHRTARHDFSAHRNRKDAQTYRDPRDALESNKISISTNNNAEKPRAVSSPDSRSVQAKRDARRCASCHDDVMRESRHEQEDPFLFLPDLGVAAPPSLVKIFSLAMSHRSRRLGHHTRKNRAGASGRPTRRLT